MSASSTPGRVSPDTAIPVTAAIVREPHGRFGLEPALLGPPASDEVLVRILATGLCHTDILARDGIMPVPLPLVLGHEGAGTIMAVGSSVTGLAPGDPVVLTYLSCGHCRQCEGGSTASCEHMRELCFGGARPDGSHALRGSEGETLNDRFFGQSSFATHCIANQRNVVKVSAEAPLEILGPLGCGVMTGAGTVWNALRVGPGDSFAVHGAGAVGLSAVMAARVAGAATIIAVDVVPSRLALARELGATHVIDAGREDSVAAIRSITKGGSHFALDTTGRPNVMQSALFALRQRGIAALVAATEPALQLDLTDLIGGCKSLVGVIEGGGVANDVVTRLVDLHSRGLFPFERMVRFYDADQINHAVEDMLAGTTIKPIIRFDGARPA